ncbi:MBL fold metallo-hydrolase [Clostridium sp.]|uniref:MBL fold metallo-hydrolase n=1 Tax=Clostridium sp. TaxID=1506 RepID=UPI00261DD6FC|nr:MBL fold metallo-hydrolase [Clostridium sp.]
MNQEIIRINLDGVNCYLVRANDNFVLFDTGGHLFMDKDFTNRRNNLEKELDKAGCKPGNLKLVILTHGDNDHVANACYIKDKYNAKIAMHCDDLELVSSPNIEKVMENCQYKSVIYKVVFLFMKKLIKKTLLKVLSDFESFQPDIYIDENYSLEEYGVMAKAIHIPGHTLGSIGILMENGDLIAGDTLSNMKNPQLAPNAYDFKLLIESVNKLRKMNIKTVYPGHGDPFEFVQL